MNNFKNDIKPIIEKIIKTVGKDDSKKLDEAFEKKFNSLETDIYGNNYKIWCNEIDRQLGRGKYAIKNNEQQLSLF